MTRAELMLVRGALAVAVAATGCAGGAGGPPVQYETGRRAATTADGLQRLKSRQVAAVYLRPGARLVGYRKLLIAPVEVFYESAGSRAGSLPAAILPPAEHDRLRRSFQNALEEELGASPSFAIVEESAPDALRVRVHVVELAVKSLTTKGGVPVYSFGGGDMTVLLDVSDSLSAVSIARLVDRKRVGPIEMVSRDQMLLSRAHSATLAPRRLGVGSGEIRSAEAQWMNSRRLFRRWASVLRKGLEELIVLGPVPELATDDPLGGKP